MLEDHQRAARMPNGENIRWYQFVRSRFVGQPNNKRAGGALTLDIQSVSLESSLHAELRGLLEYSTNLSLPVVFEFAGTLFLENREVLIDDVRGENPERLYAGTFSENGRVLTLRSCISGQPHGNLVHLIHEETISELFGK